jgi:hypothetical protein
VNPQEAARRRAIAQPAPQPQQMPFGSIRLHVISNATWLPASPLEGGAVPQYGDIELHIATLGHSELQVLPFGIAGAELTHEKLGLALARAKRARDPQTTPAAGVDVSTETMPFVALSMEEAREAEQGIDLVPDDRGMPDDIPPFSGDGPILHPNAAEPE